MNISIVVETLWEKFFNFLVLANVCVQKFIYLMSNSLNWKRTWRESLPCAPRSFSHHTTTYNKTVSRQKLYLPGNFASKGKRAIFPANVEIYFFSAWFLRDSLFKFITVLKLHYYISILYECLIKLNCTYNLSRFWSPWNISAWSWLILL